MNEPQNQSSGFDFNHPTIVALCYLGSYFTGISAIVGVVLAYMWRGENPSDWEASHYTFHIRTFWISLAGAIIGVILTIVLIGIPILVLISIWSLVRVVVALMKAQRKEPIPDPNTLWI